MRAHTPVDNFVNLRVQRGNMDVYHDRLTIVSALNDVLPQLHGTLLDVGCGTSPYRDLLLSPPSKIVKYVGLDLQGGSYASNRDLEWDGQKIPLPDSSVESVLAIEVLEHCPYPDRVLSEICRTLTPGGVFFLTVPFLWPLHDNPYDEFRYTPFSLARLLQNAGFRDVRIRARGGWDASLATMLGLWLERRPMRRWSRILLRVATKPIFKSLLRRDIVPKDFNSSCMITGLSAVGKK